MKTYSKNPEGASSWERLKIQVFKNPTIFKPITKNSSGGRGASLIGTGAFQSDVDPTPNVPRLDLGRV